MVCQKCGTEIPSDAKVCFKCKSVQPNARLCPNCGKVIDKRCAVCPKCGKKVAPIRQQQPQPRRPQVAAKKPKKPIFKKWWFWVIVVLAIGVIGAAAGGNTKNSLADSSPSADISTAPDPTPTPDQPSEALNTDPTSEISDELEPENSQNIDSSVSLDTLCVLIESVLTDNYSGCEVTHDDESVTVNVWIDGLAAELTLAQASESNSYKESWNTAKENTVSLAGSICYLIDTYGRDDVYLIFNVLNDLNHENTLLTIWESTVIYDAMA